MPEKQTSIFDETDAFMLPPRRKLLPWWIIVFSWIFLIICPIDIVSRILQYTSVDLSMFDIVPKTELAFKDVLSVANSICTLVAIYGLFREKDWAINIAILNALVSLGDILYTTNDATAGAVSETEIVVAWSIYAFGLIMLGIYLFKLFRIRKDWSIRLPRRALN